ncbi:MAG: hypothetical protein MUO29_11280, partial [Desulfobacterales bacterium]|nr:hypothetical protein [Desulfobacterales bacterium]
VEIPLLDREVGQRFAGIEESGVSKASARLEKEMTFDKKLSNCWLNFSVKLQMIEGEPFYHPFGRGKPPVSKRVTKARLPSASSSS